MVAGVCAKRAKVPKVVGYLFAGVAVKLLLQWYLRSQAATPAFGFSISDLVEEVNRKLVEILPTGRFLVRPGASSEADTRCGGGALRPE